MKWENPRTLQVDPATRTQHSQNISSYRLETLAVASSDTANVDKDRVRRVENLFFPVLSVQRDYVGRIRIGCIRDTPKWCHGQQAWQQTNHHDYRSSMFATNTQTNLKMMPWVWVSLSMKGDESDISSSRRRMRTATTTITRSNKPTRPQSTPGAYRIHFSCDFLGKYVSSSSNGADWA